MNAKANLKIRVSVSYTHLRIELNAEENAALLVRNETDSLLLKDVSADVFDSLQDADTLMVCELSHTENEKETEIVHAYEAEISD